MKKVCCCLEMIGLDLSLLYNVYCKREETCFLSIINLKDVLSIIALDIVLLQHTGILRGQSWRQDAVITTTFEMQSRTQHPPCKTSCSLFCGTNLSALCLLLVLQNKQRRAELGPWLKKSTNPRQDVSAWASEADRVLWKGWVSGAGVGAASPARYKGGREREGGNVRAEVRTQSRLSSLSQFGLPYPSWEHRCYFLFITWPISAESV